MRIVVLGAASAIGQSLAREFAPGNRLVLCGRQAPQLESLAAQCRAAGADSVRVLVHDLHSGSASVLAALGPEPVDLCINAASATSRLRDDETSLSDLRAHAEVDLLAPLGLINALRAQSPAPPGIVYISTVLAGLPSPNRAIYGALKRLHEVALLQAAKDWPGVGIRIIRVGKVLPVDGTSSGSEQLARFVRRALQGNRTLVTWGFAGRALSLLFQFQPALFQAVMSVRRGFQGKAVRRQTAA